MFYSVPLFVKLFLLSNHSFFENGDYEMNKSISNLTLFFTFSLISLKLCLKLFLQLVCSILYLKHTLPWFEVKFLRFFVVWIAISFENSWFLLHFEAFKRFLLFFFLSLSFYSCNVLVHRRFESDSWIVNVKERSGFVFI